MTDVSRPERNEMSENIKRVEENAVSENRTETVRPEVGDVVLYRMPKEWHPELGIRIYPAIVLYSNLGWGVGGVDLQVFCQPYEGEWGYHVSARRGDEPGMWRPKQPNVNQQPIS